MDCAFRYQLKLKELFAPSQNSAKASQLQSSHLPHFEILHSKYAVPQSVDPISFCPGYSK